MIPPTADLPAPDGARAEEFMALYAAHHRRLFQHILALLPRLQEAEDVMQETNLVLWRRFSEFQVGTSFYAWSSRVAYLQVLKHRKGSSRRRVALDEDVLETIAERSAECSNYLDTAREALQMCLTKLRVDDRDLILRRYMPGDSGKKLAEELGRPQNSVYKSLGRIRQGLLECIQRTLSRAAAGGRPA